jgi:hypothetical protein
MLLLPTIVAATAATANKLACFRDSRGMPRPHSERLVPQGPAVRNGRVTVAAVSDKDDVDQASLHPSMFRWSCRLRDVIESKSFQFVGATATRVVAQFSSFREVKFSSRDATFLADLPRWEKFLECYPRAARRASFYGAGYHADDKTSVPALDHDSWASRDAWAECGEPLTNLKRQKFDVLWLSTKIFISTLEFVKDDKVLSDFRVSAAGGELDEFFHFFAYRLSSFEDDVSDQPSSVVFEFLRTLASTLPATYFKQLHLVWNSRERVPSDFLSQFLAIIPHDARLTSIKGEEWTRIILRGDINCDDVRLALSHPFHPTTELSLKSTTFDESVSLGDFFMRLRKSSYLRAIELPSDLIEANDSGDSLSFNELIFKSSRQTIRYTGQVSCAMLRTISTFLLVNDLVVDFHRVTDLSMIRKSYFDSCFHGISTLERLVFCLPLWDREQTEAVTKALSETVSSFGPTSLCFFNFLCDGEPVSRVKRLDEALFPSIALNWYHKLVRKQLESNLIPLAVKAVNNGSVYQKTTDHVPFDMSIANAGVIFRMVREESKNPGYSDGPRLLGDFSSLLAENQRRSACNV